MTDTYIYRCGKNSMPMTLYKLGKGKFEDVFIFTSPVVSIAKNTDKISCLIVNYLNLSYAAQDD